MLNHLINHIEELENVCLISKFLSVENIESLGISECKKNFLIFFSKYTNTLRKHTETLNTALYVKKKMKTGKFLSFKIESIKGSEGVIEEERDEVYILKIRRKKY